ncbi:hypothetical protein [Roseivivax sp. CAU 1753]
MKTRALAVPSVATLALVPTLVLTLAGCTGSTDPETATVFDNMANTNSGEYDRQLAEKEAEAAAIGWDSDDIRADIATLEQQSAANSSRIAALRGQVASVRQEISRARVGASASDTARLGQLDRQAAAVQAEIDRGIDPSIASAELESIRAALRALSS